MKNKTLKFTKIKESHKEKDFELDRGLKSLAEIIIINDEYNKNS